MAQPKPYTPPTLSGNLLEIATAIEGIAWSLPDDCDPDMRALLALVDDLEALATDTQEPQPLPTAVCLFCGAHFARETGHTCTQLPRRQATKEAQHGAA